MKKLSSLTQVLLLAFLIRLLITGASIGDSITILGLSALYGFWLLLDSKKTPDPSEEVKTRLLNLEERLSKAENKVGAMQIIKR